VTVRTELLHEIQEVFRQAVAEVAVGDLQSQGSRSVGHSPGGLSALPMTPPATSATPVANEKGETSKQTMCLEADLVSDQAEQLQALAALTRLSQKHGSITPLTPSSPGSSIAPSIEDELDQERAAISRLMSATEYGSDGRRHSTSRTSRENRVTIARLRALRELIRLQARHELLLTSSHVNLAALAAFDLKAVERIKTEPWYADARTMANRWSEVAEKQTPSSPAADDVAKTNGSQASGRHNQQRHSVSDRSRCTEHWPGWENADRRR